MLHSTKLLNKVLMVLVALLLLFSTNYGAFKTSEAHANALTATFEEWAAASYATAVVATTTVAASAMHTEQYLKDNIDEMYQTAKETWPKMSADMRSNFLSSLDQMADGVIVAGDWVTAGLDALKAKFGSTGSTLPNVGVIQDSSSVSFNLSSRNVIFSFETTDGHVRTFNSSISLSFESTSDGPCGDTLAFRVGGSGFLGDVLYKGFYSSSFCGANYAEGLSYYGQAQSIDSLTGLKSFLESLYGVSVVITLDGNVVNPANNTYNKMDQWLRDVAIPAGNLGVYVPTDAMGWTPDGYRLGLSEDGQQLLKLPDGTPWEGDYSWRQPLLDTMDGVPAILDSAIGSWVDLHTGKKIRDATIPEMASATGVDESTAEYVLIRAKDEEKAREEEKGTDSEPLREEVSELGENKAHHILQDKHDWHKVSRDPKDWEEISRIISKVLNEGKEGPYKAVYSKILRIGDEIVEVTYAKMKNGTIKISDAWVRNASKTKMNSLVINNNIKSKNSLMLRGREVNSMLKQNILEGNFKIANDIAKEMSLGDLENDLLEIAFETDNISIYFFILDLLNEDANAELHAMASTILSTAYSHVAGSYNLALNHMRKAMQLDPHDLTYKEGMLLFYNIPEQLITKAQAIELADEIIKINPENERAKEILQ